MNRLLTKKQLATHKRRLDRGGIYYGYFQMISTGAILVRVFGITQWWIYVIGVLSLAILRYISGYYEEKKGILAAEQRGYSELNPYMTEMMRDIKDIKKRLNGE